MSLTEDNKQNDKSIQSEQADDSIDSNTPDSEETLEPSDREKKIAGGAAVAGGILGD